MLETKYVGDKLEIKDDKKARIRFEIANLIWNSDRNTPKSGIFKETPKIFRCYYVSFCFLFVSKIPKFCPSMIHSASRKRVDQDWFNLDTKIVIFDPDYFHSITQNSQKPVSVFEIRVFQGIKLPNLL